MKGFTPLSLLLLLLLPAAAGAQPWSGEAALGVLSTSGNSETRSINGKFALDYLQGRWHNAFLTQAVNAADEGETTGERYLLTDKLDFTFSDRNYLFLSGEYEKDLFSAIRTRISETTGVGRHLLAGPVHFLDAEIGAGARQQEAQESREKDANLIGRFATEYQWRFAANNALREQIKVESGEANTFAQSLTELKLSIVGNLFAALSFTVQYNSQVEPGVKHSDSTTAVNFSYAFGKPPN